MSEAPVSPKVSPDVAEVEEETTIVVVPAHRDTSPSPPPPRKLAMAPPTGHGRIFQVHQVYSSLSGGWRFDAQELELSPGDSIRVSWRTKRGQLVVQTDDTYQPLPVPSYESWNVNAAAPPQQAEKDKTPTGDLTTVEDLDGSVKLEEADPETKYSASELTKDNSTTTGSTYGKDISRSHVFTFPAEGTFCFASNNPVMVDSGCYIRVKVTAGKRHVARAGFTVLGALLLVTALFAAVVSGFVFLDTNMVFFASSEGDSDESYRGRKELQSLLLRYAAPWWAFGLLTFLVWIVAMLVASCKTFYLSAYGPGYRRKLHTVMQGIMWLLIMATLGIVAGFWRITIERDHQFSTFLSTLSASTLNTLKEVQILIRNVEFLISELPVIFPTITIDSSAQTLLVQVNNIADLTRLIATYGDDAIRSLLRVISILTFLSLQFILMSLAMGIVGVFRKKATTVRAAVWCVGLSFVLTCFALGLGWISFKVLDRSVTVIESFEGKTLTKAELSVASGLERDTPLMAMFGVCLDDGYLQLDFLNSVMDDIAEEFNQLVADATGSASSSDLELARSNMTNSSGLPVNLTTILAYSDFLISQLDLLDSKLEANPAALESVASELTARTGPVMRAVAAIAKSSLGIVECKILRDTIVDSLPFLREVISKFKVQLALHTTIFALHILFAIIGFLAAHVFARPFKRYHSSISGRAFIFHWSFLAHERILRARREEVEADGKDFVYEDEPEKSKWCSILYITSATYNTNLFNSVLVFFQAFLLMLYHASYSDNKLPQALQVVCVLCVVAPFASFSAEVGNQVLLRVLLRILSLGCAVIGIILCFTSANEAVEDSTDCLSKITAARSGSVNTTTYPFQMECQMDVVVQKVEIGVFAILVGLVLLFKALTSFLLFLWSNRTQSQLDLGEVESLFTGGGGDGEFTGGLSGLLGRVKAQRTRRRRFQMFACISIIAGVLASLVLLILFVLLSGSSLAAEAFEPGGGAIVGLSPDGCNGYQGLCEKKLNEVVWMTSHNAMSSSDGGFVAPNHYHDLKTQMINGVRAFMFDFHPNETAGSGGLPVMQCHGSCDLGGYPLLQDLSTIREFLVSNSTAVLIIVVEQLTTTNAIADAFTAANLTSLIWTSSTGSPVSNTSFQFPTLQELIVSDRRLLIFTDKATAAATAPFMHYMWDFFYETHWNIKDVGDFTCVVNRGSASSSVLKSKMSILNHFVTNPVGMPMLAAEANAAESITEHFDTCVSEWGTGRLPNLVALDFWTIRNPLKTVDKLQNKYVL